MEFDEDVDLSSVQEIKKEFLVLNRAYLCSHKYPAVTLQFRKLGKHKTTALYCPGLDTLCVAIRSPASFIHEFFHMIYDQLGGFVLEIEFEPLVEEYKQAFEKSYEKLDSTTKERLSGNAKYNKSYFFRQAEIFARCGEIYLVKILKVENFLIQPDFAYAYAPSEKLDRLIKALYDKLLEKNGGAYLIHHHTLVLTCELWTYLADPDEQTWERLDAIMEQMKAAEGVTEELKAKEQWAWVQNMNSIRN